MVWEISLPKVGVVLPFGVQLVPPWVEPAFRESEKHKKRKTEVKLYDEKKCWGGLTNKRH